MTSVAIINMTRNVVLARHAQVAADPVRRFIGLLGQRSLSAESGMVLRDCSAIHTLGMRFAIDALYVDAQGLVVRVVSCLSPWRIGPVEPRADAIIELPAGALATSQTVIGDRIVINDGG